MSSTKKQFLRHFIQKIWVRDKKIVDMECPDAFQILLQRDLVRIRDMLLGLVDKVRTYFINSVEVIYIPIFS
jgi:hypothetical protein